MGFSVGNFGGRAAAECVSLDPKFWRAISMYPPKRQFFGNFASFCLGGYFMSPPTQRFLAIFSEAGILCPLQLSNFWQFFGSFFLCLIFCAPRLHKFLAILAKFWESGRFLVGLLLGKLLCSPIFKHLS
jgi:hypothetical protein